MRYFFENPPQTDDDLWMYLYALTGWQFTRRAVIPGHDAPFQALADMYFERETQAIWWASRNGGKTAQVAALNLLDELKGEATRDPMRICHLGAIDQQAKRCHDYQVRWILQNPDVLARINGDPLTERIEWLGGSEIEVHALTKKQASGPHVPKLRIDELDQVDRWDVFQQALSIPETQGAHQSSTLITSTRDSMSGCMARQIEEAQENSSYRIYEWNVWDVLQTCPPERKCRECPALEHCQGGAKRLPAGGWYQIQDFIKKCQTLDSETLETQWFNMRPGLQLSVYGRFWADERNEADDHEIPADAQRIRSFDFGHTVCGWYYVKNRFVVKYDEEDFGDCPSQFLAQRVKDIEATRPWHLARDDQGRMSPAPITRTYGDPAGADYIRNLRAGGISVTRANNDIKGGINTVRAWMEKGWFKVMKRCKYSRKHLKAYSWEKNPDGSPKLWTPRKDGHDHFPDETRYALHSFKTTPGGTTGKRV